MKKQKQVNEFLYNDEATMNSFLKKEEDVMEVVAELKELSVKALGASEVDWKLYLNDPSNYLVDSYWTLFSPAPKHLEVNKASIFENHTNCDVNHLKALKQKFSRAMTACDRFAPKVTKTGVKSTIKKDDFNKYLDPKKAKKYHALVKFISAADEIKAMEYGTQGIHLIRFCSGLIFVNTDVKINMSEYAL